MVLQRRLRGGAVILEARKPVARSSWNFWQKARDDYEAKFSNSRLRFSAPTP